MKKNDRGKIEVNPISYWTTRIGLIWLIVLLFTTFSRWGCTVQKMVAKVEEIPEIKGRVELLERRYNEIEAKLDLIIQLLEKKK
jgi:hypothetical protein